MTRISPSLLPSIILNLTQAIQTAARPLAPHRQASEALNYSPIWKSLPKREGSSGSEGASVFRKQFSNPTEIFSVLLLIGGDVIQKAVAQMAGPTILTPVAFSFGWVAYTFNSLINAIGDGTFLPSPDCPGSVVVLGSGDTRINQAWVIGRLIRDLELDVEREFESWDDTQTGGGKTGTGDTGLLVTVYETLPTAEQHGRGGYVPKKPKKDVLWWTYFPVTLSRLAIGAIPWILYDDWAIFFVTACGITLALVTGSLPTIFQEKYKCRKGSKSIYAITRGNGYRHIFIILPNSRKPEESTALYLDDLASAVQHGGWRARASSIMFAALWVGFIITVGGIDANTWYLLGIGGLGMVHNIFVAGWHRASEAHGIPLRRTKKMEAEFGRRKKDNRRPGVMKVLFDVEDAIPGARLALRGLFFTGALRDDEIKKWEIKTKDLDTRKARWIQEIYK